MDERAPDPKDGARLFCYLERRRDVLLCYTDPRPLHLELDLHLLTTEFHPDPFTVQLLKDGLSALALWQVSRPRFETFGWTISLREPPLNLFFTGSPKDGTVVGRAFLEHVAPAAVNMFFAQTSRPQQELQTSAVEVEGVDVFGMVEQYSLKSDGLPLRFFHREEERVALLAPLPDADREWIERVSADEVFTLEEKGEEKREIKLISERRVRFHCGCDVERITKIVYDVYRGNAEDFFHGEEQVEGECPRCGTLHLIRRQSFDRLAAGAPKPGEPPLHA